MANYFEPLTIFPYAVGEGDSKKIPRISVDMGISTFLCFAINEISLFQLKYSTEGVAFKNDKDKLLSILHQARGYIANVDQYYTMLDYAASQEHLRDLIPRLRDNSYSVAVWDYTIAAIERYEPIAEI